MPRETMPEGDNIVDIRDFALQRAQTAQQEIGINREAAARVAPGDPAEQREILDRLNNLPDLLSAAQARRADLAAGEVSADMGQLTKTTVNGVEAWRYTSPAAEAQRQRGSQYYDTFQLDPDVPYEEAFMATAYGPQLVKIPLKVEDKRDIFTTPLEMMEKTREQNGGAAIQENVQLAQQLLQVLLSRRYLREHQDKDDENAYATILVRDKDDNFVPKKIPVGEKLLEEFISRQHIHAAYLGFDNSDDINNVINTHKTIQSLHLNELFQIPEFVHAVQYYEDHGVEFVKRDRDKFRNNALREIKSTLTAKLGSKFLKDRNDEDLFWAVNLAERFWELSAERALQDTTKVDEFNPGRVAFQDDLAGANFLIRRMDFGNWASTQQAGFKAYPQLIKGFKEYGDYIHDPDYQSDLRLFDVKGFFREIADNDEMKKINPGFLRSGVTGKQGRYDFINTDWQKFDFRALGDNPMFNWSFRNFYRNENARAPFAADPDKYYRNPSIDSLLALNPIWDFRGADQWKIKELLLKNFLEFARHERSEETGKLKYDIDAMRANIKKAAGMLEDKDLRFIDPKSMDRITTEVLGKEPIWRQMIENNGARFTFYFLFGFIKEFITEYWSYGLNEKKN